MRKIICGCGTTLRGESDDVLLARAEHHIANHHAGVSGSTRREDLLALAEDDGPLAAGTHEEMAA